MRKRKREELTSDAVEKGEMRSCCESTVMCVVKQHVNLGFVADHRFGRELDFSGFEDGVLLEDVLLRLVMAKGLQNDTHSKSFPNILTILIL